MGEIVVVYCKIVALHINIGENTALHCGRDSIMYIYNRFKVKISTRICSYEREKDRIHMKKSMRNCYSFCLTKLTKRFFRSTLTICDFIRSLYHKLCKNKLKILKKKIKIENERFHLLF